MKVEDALARFEERFVRPKEGRTLIVGSYVTEGKEDRRRRYPHVLGVDMREGPGVDLVHDLEKPLPDRLQLFDHVECLSVMEHCRRPWLMAQSIERAMAPGATLHLVAPFAWRIHSYPDDYFRFTVNGLKSLFTKIDWQAEAWAGPKLSQACKIKSTTVSGYPYLARTEACLFGVKL